MCMTASVTLLSVEHDAENELDKNAAAVEAEVAQLDGSVLEERVKTQLIMNVSSHISLLTVQPSQQTNQL